ncbi:MAG: outer membrane beta-barrel protein [Vicinamibacterales bacterium]
MCGILTGIALFAAPAAYAQAPSPSTSKFFASVDIGAQLAARTLDMAASQTVYDETATVNASLPIGKGVVPGFGVGYRVFGDVFVGVSVTMFSNTGTATTTASIPDPLFFGRPKTVTGTVSDLKHRELAVLPQLMYTRAVTDKIDFVGAVGPAIISLKQDTISSFSVPTGTQNVTFGTIEESKTGTGINGMIGLNYNLTEKVAIGAFARFAGAKVQLASALDKQNVGGMQAGVGLRYNF